MLAYSRPHANVVFLGSNLVAITRRGPRLKLPENIFSEFIFGKNMNNSDSLIVTRNMKKKHKACNMIFKVSKNKFKYGHKIFSMTLYWKSLT